MQSKNKNIDAKIGLTQVFHGEAFETPLASTYKYV